MEGNECSFSFLNCDPSGFIPPVMQYEHDPVQISFGNAIIGGFVYRGTLMPSLYGQYIYADVSGTIWSYDPVADQKTLLLDSGNLILSISQGIDDYELYLLSQQQIYRFTESGNDPAASNTFPLLLSETGCFDVNDPKIPGSMLIPYDINVQLWSDGAAKDRWMALPDNTTIQIDSDGDWHFPVGTVLLKNFSLQNQLIETRYFVRHADGMWAGYSYEWNDAQTEATLVPPEGKTRPVGSQTWTYPSRSQCLVCHTIAAGRTLGPETAQLNKSMLYPGSGIQANQLETLDYIGMFDVPLPDLPANLPSLPEITDTSIPIEERARGYLHTNCSMCHRAGGFGRGFEDFRWHIPLEQMRAVNIKPKKDNLGVADARLVFSGHPEKSVLSLRIHALNDNRMPPLGTKIVDPVGTQVIDNWIRSLTGICVAPLINAQSEKGVFVWKNCSTGEWQIQSTAGGDSRGVVYNGTISTNESFANLVPVSLEGSDILDLKNNASTIDFRFKIWGTGRDGAIFTVPDNATLCLDVSSADTGKKIFLGTAKNPVTAPFDLASLSSCGNVVEPEPGTVKVLKAKYYPADKKLWVRASSNLQPSGADTIKVTVTSNGVDQQFGDLIWRSNASAYQRAYGNIASVPDCVTVTSTTGASAQLPVAPGADCSGGSGSTADNVIINRAIYYSSQNRLWIKANSDALPAGSATLRATAIKNGVRSILGTVSWKANKNAYQQVFFSIGTLPDSVELSSDFGGISTSNVEGR